MAFLYYCFATLFLLQGLLCLEYVHNITFSTPLLVNQTLVSWGQVFELGFFRPSSSENLYVAIWYKDKPLIKPVWVANRENPLASTDQSASLTIGTDGNLKIFYGQQNMVWSTNVSAGSNSSVAQLLDDGNLVLTSGSSGDKTWESFDYPGDIILAGMKIGIDSQKGVKKLLTSWKSDINPSPGNFTLGISSEIPSQAFIWSASGPYFRTGQWNKYKFIGIPNMDRTYDSRFIVQEDFAEKMFYLSFHNNSFLEYLFLSPGGSVKLMSWNDELKKLLTTWEAPKDRCEVYGTCGPFGVCSASESPICSCLSGFKPKSTEEWSNGNWTLGCTRNVELNCEKERATSSSVPTKSDVFAKKHNIKLPDFANYIPHISNDEDCGKRCLSNCSCLAYSFVDTIGCMVWTRELIDIQQFYKSGGDLNFRLGHFETGAKKRPKLVIGLTSFFSIIILASAVYGLSKWRTHQNGKFCMIPWFLHSVNENDAPVDKQKESEWRDQLKKKDAPELAILSFDCILTATNKFNISNKLGQGGFGPVYKGKLQDGRDVAIKRLSSNSGQGMLEFKNEILLISKLQHRNLVRLLGCCNEEGEKILVYEYMSNKSLDTFLFDPRRKKELNWDKRSHIIQGIARGLLYLHQDSYLRVIHRDLKVSNILLDEKFNPKISDFGLARMFQGTQEWVNTHKVVGTFGYISSEYAMGGIFSEKSDVYSFGVLLLETVSSKTNSPLYYQGQYLNLLSYAWLLWNEDRALDLMDEALAEASQKLEAIKCIQVGLLCVQDHAVDRPDMYNVVLMLSGESNLPEPKQPTFTFQGFSDLQPRQESMWSTNQVTDSFIEGR